MTLAIDTTNREKIILKLLDEKIEKCFEFDTIDQSADLLMAINGILKQAKLSLKDLQAIVVNSGPGSFTGVRVGVTVANTLAWLLDIPVYGFQTEDFEKTLVKISPTRLKHFSQIALPHYPPQI